MWLFCTPFSHLELYHHFHHHRHHHHRCVVVWFSEIIQYNLHCNGCKNCQSTFTYEQWAVNSEQHMFIQFIYDMKLSVQMFNALLAYVQCSQCQWWIEDQYIIMQLRIWNMNRYCCCCCCCYMAVMVHSFSSISNFEPSFSFSMFFVIICIGIVYGLIWVQNKHQCCSLSLLLSLSVISLSYHLHLTKYMKWIVVVIWISAYNTQLMYSVTPAYSETPALEYNTETLNL